ncbi:multidrug resistance-associated protein 1-like [Macrosteles quadrilineatus]|uniref:multidrug resistance-associated protein 1-like n=1 Tax=Macrosteles quadrilineatus TaxID=74068 RepID=UPI0023E1E96F|nr:multidrug resistance-associated protein 1-like [Macrosteles quadrilineatus]XP_054270086.1 multidrug resistance-associated protein 1-like [Macrosteles quadrilineatus]
MTSYLDDLCGSQFWDANVTWHTEDPDLTPCFEKTVLVWLPGLFLLLFVPVEFCSLRNSKAKHIPWSWLNISKIVVVTLLMAVSIANLLYKTQQAEVYPADYAAPTVQLVIFSVILTLILLHKSNGQRISYALFFISLVLVICQTPQIYSFIRAYINGTLQDAVTTSLNVTVYILQLSFFFLNFFCDKAPTYNEYPAQEKPSPEISASVPSRLTLSWFTPTVMQGARKPLSAEDMYSLNHENSCRIIVPEFEGRWEASLQQVQRPKVSYDKRSSKIGFYRPVRPQASILPALLRTFGPMFLVGSFFKFAQDLILFANPQLLKLLIQFVSSDESLWKGCMYAALMFLTTNVQMFFLNRYFLTMNFVGARINTGLISTIYKKSLKLSNAARKQSTVGEIVNLMAVDAASFQQLMQHLNLVWSAPMQIVLSLYFLWQLLGPAVLAGLTVMILMVPLNAWMVRQNRRLRIKQMKHKDERIKTMNEVLSGIKVLKLYAWEPSFEQKITKIRQKEVRVLKTAAYFNSFSMFAFSMTPFLVALVSFATFVLYDDRNILDAEIAFVSLSLFNILRFPLNMLPQVLNSIVSTAVSIKRINKFLNNEELDTKSVSHDPSERDVVVVENGTFAWDGSDDNSVVLRNINLRVSPGQLIMVVGSVGSGKSSLLAAILGEMDKLSGRVNTKGNIAYVPQQAWMQNATLRKNITGPSEFDKTAFRRVVKSCALEQDIGILPGGDLTEIGEKGINLSGGQKQRISLARAVYSKADLYLLDDPLSAVDAHVGKHIFENVIGPKGVLRNTTRVLVTHGVGFLPEADLIVVVKDGQISESGTYKQLVRNKGDFADFLLQYLEEAQDLDIVDELDGIKEELLKDESLRDRYMRAISVKSEDAGKTPKLERQMSKESTKSNGSAVSCSKNSINKEGSDEPEKQDKKKLMTVEESETGNVKFNVFVYYMRAIGMWRSMLAIVAVFLYQGFTVTTNLWLSEWSSDRSVVVNGTQDISKTHMYLGVYAGLGFAQALCNVVSNITLSQGCLIAAAWLHLTMLNRIVRAPMSYFDTTPLGRIVNRFSRDIDVCDSILSFSIQAFLGLAIQTIATIGVITYTTPMFILIIIPIFIINFSLQRLFVATSRQLKRLESTNRSPIYSHFGETVQGAQSIRAYGLQKAFISESEYKLDHYQMCNYPNFIAARWLAIRLEAVGNFIVFFAALFAVLYRETLDPGLAGLSITYALQVTSSLNFFTRTTADVETNMVAVERIKEYTQISQEAAWTVEPVPEASWPDQGQIEFRDYRVRYREGLELVLSGVTFTILPGEKVGIVGRTGAGKSSLTLALFRILEAAGGAICIDGKNIAAVGLHDLRGRLTIIPQDPVLFSGTLRNNLDPFDLASDQTIWKALELSNLKSFVTSLPSGLNHLVSEGGENLSVGQKQLICLGRALLRKSRVLVLDEATAAVDLETDDIIQKTIRREFKDCTILTIAHRLHTIMDYDRILVLDKGKVKEYDSPNKLLQDPNTIFYSMAKESGIVT